MIALGIDTSNYTTSASIYDGENYVLKRKILDVGEGKRGIRQSDGVFIHNRELPQIISDITAKTDVTVIGVSTRPRCVEGSYMPVFTVGQGYAKAISSVSGINLYEFSHQDGHIMAGIHSCGEYSLLDSPFISVHLSGGTTEILASSYNGYNFENEIIGGTLDISAGQLIDRIGVNMGLKFPCGIELEKLAKTTSDSVKLPISIKDSHFNLSGVETKLLNGIGEENNVVARSVLIYIKDILVKSICNAIITTGIRNVLFVGGVASNEIIRDGLEKELDANVFFASKELSSDNAVGLAILAYMAEEKRNG